MIIYYYVGAVAVAEPHMVLQRHLLHMGTACSSSGTEIVVRMVWYCVQKKKKENSMHVSLKGVHKNADMPVAS